jgi:transcriptional regulator MraZ
LSFHGIHDLKLDAKNRLTVPAKSRAELAAGVTLVKGLESFLEVWPSDDYGQIVRQSLAGLNPLEPKARELKRHLYGNSAPSELDTAGRIGISRDFLEHAGLGKDVVLVGIGDCFEVWDRERWKSKQSDLVAKAADHIASIGHPA